MTDVKKLPAEERDALAEIALRQRERSRLRSQKARAARMKEGLVRVSVWCPHEIKEILLTDMRKMIDLYRKGGIEALKDVTDPD